MFLRDLLVYADTALDGTKIGIALLSIETGRELAVVFDIVADISEYGEWIFRIAVKP
jgi:hypothetical protein